MTLFFFVVEIIPFKYMLPLNPFHQALLHALLTQLNLSDFTNQKIYYLEDQLGKVIIIDIFASSV